MERNYRLSRYVRVQLDKGRTLSYTQLAATLRPFSRPEQQQE